MPVQVAGRSRLSGFQSAPGQLAGRCPSKWLADPAYRGFNPRPANWPGDADEYAHGHHAVHGFNPRPANWPGDAPNCIRPILQQFRFNPRPANWPGDAQVETENLGALFNVSIRARPIGRAMLSMRQSPGRLLEFQSAPGQLAGRCSWAQRRSRLVPGFNPRPANWPGDAIGTPWHLAPYEVSIRARPIGRAMPYVCRRFGLTRFSFNPRPANWPGDVVLLRCWLALALGFNPRPANWPGDARYQRRPPDAEPVSIRARPIGRAMRQATAQRPRLPGCFNPRPANWPGDAIGISQPAAITHCFNPRPANWPGDAK